MNAEQVGRIMNILTAAYPRFYGPDSGVNPKAVASLWAEMFREDDVQVVAYAVKAFIQGDTKGFPPHIGAIKERVRQITEPPMMTEAEAWGFVRNALRNSSYGAEKEFSKLPDIVKRLVGSPSQLREWAAMDEETVQSVVASNFQRSYRSRAQSEREFAALPEDVKKFATALGASLSLDQSPHKVEEPKEALPQDTKTRTVEAVQNFEKALSALKNERSKQEKKSPVQKHEPKRELTNEEQEMMDRWKERRKVAGISD